MDPAEYQQLPIAFFPMYKGNDDRVLRSNCFLLYFHCNPWKRNSGFFALPAKLPETAIGNLKKAEIPDVLTRLFPLFPIKFSIEDWDGIKKEKHLCHVYIHTYRVLVHQETQHKKQDPFDRGTVFRLCLGIFVQKNPGKNFQRVHYLNPLAVMIKLR